MTAAEHRGAGADGAAAPARGAVEDHLAALDAVLHGPARVKSRMLAEVRDGLADAADAHAEAGAPSPAAAAARAVRDFGTVAEVGPAFQRELTVAQARQTARIVALVVPFLMACWYLVGATAQDAGGRLPAAVHVLAANLGGLAALAALLAAGSLAATGALAHRAATPRQLPLVVAWTGTTAAVALAVSALTLTAGAVLAQDWPAGALAGAVTLVAHTRLAASARACRHCALLAR
ncbi:permease prefix domain 1-containing protein [Streptomyces sp. NPDC004134]|uniref:permease prefix domain 1-containing protein n=1 Tax=Streptomyces sp. NPDC004134 TaxID=3364691 RepID=UPI00368D1FEF